MIRKINLLLALIFTSIVAYSQINIAEKYQKGEVVLTNGETIQGYIFLNFSKPQDFQHHVSIISNETYQRLSNKRVKNKDIQHFKAKQIRFFKTANGRKFVSVSYLDFSKMGVSPMPHHFLMEELVSGSITLYKRYPELGHPGAEKMVSMSDQQRWNYTQSHFELLILKGEQTPKSVVNINVKEFIADNASIMKKFEANHYGSLKEVFSAIVKFGEVKVADHLEAFVDLAKDYNQKMSLE